MTLWIGLVPGSRLRPMTLRVLGVVCLHARAGLLSIGRIPFSSLNTMPLWVGPDASVFMHSAAPQAHMRAGVSRHAVTVTAWDSREEKLDAKLLRLLLVKDVREDHDQASIELRSYRPAFLPSYLRRAISARPIGSPFLK